MKKFVSQHRWLVPLGAVLIQLALGILYAWSVFTTPLIESGWTKTQTQLVFSTGLVTFAVVMVLAGKLMKKIGSQALSITGGSVLAIAFLLPGIIESISFITLLLTVGFLAGVGIGLTYVVPIAIGMRWYPDKKGLITGLGVAGFGFGATLWVKLAGSWGNLIANHGLMSTFSIYGLMLLVLTALGGLVMVSPPKNWHPPQSKSSAEEKENSTKTQSVTNGSLDSLAMLRTPQFYMLSTVFAFAASAGLMVIGLMKIFPNQALMTQNSTMSSAEASAIAGTAMAVFFSLANGIGRIAWGAMSDKLSQKTSMVVMTLTQGILMILFPFVAGGKWLLFLFSTLIGFNYGGAFSLFPATTAQIFGPKYIGQNYGWVFLAYGVGGIVGPMLGGKLADLGNMPLAFTICGVLCLVAAGISSQLKDVRLG